MSKIRSNVYKEIRDRLKSKMPELVYIDLQKGQFAKREQNYPVPLPACLVEFGAIKWSNTTGEQIGDAQISTYLYIDLVTDSFDNAELENETIEILDTQDDLFDSLHGFTGKNFNPLSRTSDSPHEYGEGYVCFKVDFRTTIFPNGKIKTTKKPNPKLTLKINKNGNKNNNTQKCTLSIGKGAKK